MLTLWRLSMMLIVRPGHILCRGLASVVGVARLVSSLLSSCRLVGRLARVGSMVGVVG